MLNLINRNNFVRTEEQLQLNETLLDKTRCYIPEIDADPVAWSALYNMINSGICTGVLHCAGQHPLRWQGIILGPTVFMQANNRKLYLNIIRIEYV